MEDPVAKVPIMALPYKYLRLLMCELSKGFKCR